jgi:hypothetical protein
MSKKPLARWGGRILLGAMIRGGFLTAEERQDLTELARDGLAEHSLARRANALVLLDREASRSWGSGSPGQVGDGIDCGIEQRFEAGSELAVEDSALEQEIGAPAGPPHLLRFVHGPEGPTVRNRTVRNRNFSQISPLTCARRWIGHQRLNSAAIMREIMAGM